MVLHRDEFPDPPALDEHVLKSAAGVLVPFQSQQLRDAEPRSQERGDRGVVAESLVRATAWTDAECLCGRE